MTTTFSLIDGFSLSGCDDCASDDECRTCGTLSGSEIMMIQGIASFGDLGSIERLAFGSMIIAGENVEAAPPRSGMGYLATSWGVDVEDEGEGDFEPGEDEDVVEAAEAEEAEIAEEEGEGEEEALETSAIEPRERIEALRKILEQRRTAIGQAKTEAAKEEATVEKLDKKIVDELRPQYEAALKTNAALAQRLAATMQILNAQRAAAFQRATNWIKFQGLAGQMARQARAQAALVVAYAAAKKAGDVQQMKTISAAFVKLGKASQEMKQVRGQQKVKWNLQAQHRRMANLSRLLRKYNAALKKILRGRKPSDLTGKDAASYAMFERSIKRAVESYRKSDAAFKKAYLTAQKPLNLPPAEITPEEEQAIEEIQDVRTIVPGLGESIPYCAVYTRGEKGPYCSVQTKMDWPTGIAGLGDLGGFWKKFGRAIAGVVTGGASELALNKKIRGGIKKAAKGVYKGIKTIAKKVICPIANAVNKSLNAKKAEIKGEDKKAEEKKPDEKKMGDLGLDAKDAAKSNPYVAAASVASAAVASACKPGTKPSDTDEAKKAKAEGIVEVVEVVPIWRRWWFFPLAILAGGIGAAVYLGQSPSGPGMRGIGSYGRKSHYLPPRRGLGRLPRRKRRRSQKALGCGCGA